MGEWQWYLGKMKGPCDWVSYETHSYVTELIHMKWLSLSRHYSTCTLSFLDTLLNSINNYSEDSLKLNEVWFGMPDEPGYNLYIKMLPGYGKKTKITLSPEVSCVLQTVFFETVWLTTVCGDSSSSKE